MKTRNEALDAVRRILAEIPLEPDDRDRLFAAVIDYGHAAASEVLQDCRRIIEATLIEELK